jgi:phosphoglycolate phosphatase-like HAD superfamily hydrolase
MASSTSQQFVPQLVIFDKDGTLIDFGKMWRAWLVELASRLERASRLELGGRFFSAMGFEPVGGRIAPQGRLATETMSDMRAWTVAWLCQGGLSRQRAEKVVAAAWFVPDPVAEARPLADLPTLFNALRTRGLKIAIVTLDDRAPTEATLASLGVASLVDALACADDGLALKPAPDMVWAVCRATGVEPARAVVVGDAEMDLRMGRAAGVGLVVGVFSGLTPQDALAPHADVLLASVTDLTIMEAIPYV